MPRNLQKHERELIAMVRDLGARAVDIIKPRRGHPRVVGLTPDGRRFVKPFPGSAGDCNWHHAARRDVLRIFRKPQEK